MPASEDNQLGIYLRERRARLDPVALGFPVTRRRTPGLRREEVAQRANVSATWYTWLEQGRGGAPSPDVLDRLARGLMLTELEREHLFLLALGHPPEVRYQARAGVSPQLQHVLDALEFSPAFVKNVTWDLVAWNRAAAAIFRYDELQPEKRNILRRIFLDPNSRAAQVDWPAVARFAVATFRADTARVGASAEAKALVAELCGLSSEFAAIWREQEVGSHREGTKHLRHPDGDTVSLEYSTFWVDGRPDLSLVVYNPVTRKDADRIRALVKSSTKGKRIRAVA